MLMNGHYRAETREESRRGEEGKAVGGERGEYSGVGTEGAAVRKKGFNLHLRFL